MSEGSEWIQPRENSVDALVHGMMVSDGVEFDLRLTTDEELVLHHDPRTLTGRFPEQHTSSELSDEAESFESLLSQSDFARPWVEEARFVCIELKPPHPSSGKGGGWTSKVGRREHLTRMIERLDEMLDEIGVPESNCVVYSFDSTLDQAVKTSGSDLKFARLQPHMRQWGGSFVQKVVSTPSFIGHSLIGLVNSHRLAGAPLLPVAIDYIHGFKRHLTMGQTAGISGSQLEKFNRRRAGFPVFVWSAGLALEHELLEGGMSVITDDLNPGIEILPSGQQRRLRPATMPDGKTPWHELSDSERQIQIETWKTRWNWARSMDHLLEETSEASMPWEAVRLIGHRGAGRTSKS